MAGLVEPFPAVIICFANYHYASLHGTNPPPYGIGSAEWALRTGGHFIEASLPVGLVRRTRRSEKELSGEARRTGFADELCARADVLSKRPYQIRFGKTPLPNEKARRLAGAFGFQPEGFSNPSVYEHNARLWGRLRAPHTNGVKHSFSSVIPELDDERSGIGGCPGIGVGLPRIGGESLVRPSVGTEPR